MHMGERLRAVATAVLLTYTNHSWIRQSCLHHIPRRLGNGEIQAQVFLPSVILSTTCPLANCHLFDRGEQSPEGVEMAQMCLANASCMVGSCCAMEASDTPLSCASFGASLSTVKTALPFPPHEVSGILTCNFSTPILSSTTYYLFS